MLKNLTLLAFVMAIVVVVLGAYTRLADAGLGCPDWPTCYGHLWVPNSESEIAHANQRFEATPVETDKTWPEQIHRLFASSLGLVIFGMFGLAARERAKHGEKWKANAVLLLALIAGTIARVVIGDAFDAPLFLFAAAYFAYLLYQWQKGDSTVRPYKLFVLLSGLVILQGWFGMWTVTLYLWPQVVTTHLLGGFTTLALLWLAFQRVSSRVWEVTQLERNALKPFVRLTWIFFGLVVAQIVLGGWTTSNYAALACPDFPTCHAAWWPQADFVQGFNVFQHVGPNYLGGQLDNHARTAIHFSHRIGALLVLLYGVFLITRMYLSAIPKLKPFALLFALVLLAQVGLGITNVVAGLPLIVAVAHNAGGALLLICIVTLLHRLYSARAN